MCMRSFLVATALAYLVLAFAAATAHAELSHPFVSTLSQEGAFHDPCGSTTDSEGDLYVAAYQDNAVKIYDASGAFVTEFTPSANGPEPPCGLAVDSAGNIYVNGWGTDVVKYNPSAYPPTSGTTYSADTSVNGTGKVVSSGATSVAVDPATQNVYVALGDHISSFHPNGTLISSAIGSGVAGVSYYGVDVLGKNGDVYATDKAHSKAYIFNPSGSTVLVEIDGSESKAGAFSFGSSYPYLAVDQSNGHVYVADVAGHGVVDEFDAAGYFVSELSHSFEEGEPSDIAVDDSGGPNQGNVYVTAGAFNASGSVYAFGPLAGGIVPTVTIEPTTEKGISKAKFNGTINPQSVPNSYHFEWKQGTGTSWAGAKSSPPQSLSEDSIPHAVTLNATGLKGGTTYQVRLVARNTENGLEAISNSDAFTTLQPPSPTVTNLSISSVTASSAHVAATINPQEDETTWRILASTDVKPGASQAECEALGESKFTKVKEGTIPSETSGTIAVAADLAGLMPAQTYCVRVIATNGNPTPGTGNKVIQTLAISPTDVETAFAAPRLDTSARLNGRVNPEGEALTYYFEYSEDGGATWIELAPQISTSEAREQIVVGEELENLIPSTQYLYRFVAENPAGSVTGAEMTFTTRATAEVTSLQPCPNEDVRQKQHSDSYLADCRAIELVNSPDKGNQNLFATIGLPPNPMMTSDGETALWWVTGGASGGTASAGDTFLAERTASGWHSRNLVPPPTQQFGNANLPYRVEKATPGFGAFIFNAGSNALDHGKTLVRLDRSQHQEVLASYENATPERLVNAEYGEISDDGAHVLIINPETRQLEDIGNSKEAAETISMMPSPGSPLGVPQPGGTPSACGLAVDSGKIGESFAGVSASHVAAGNDWNPGYRMIAAKDASRVYFEVRPDGDCSGPYGLYERNRATDATTLIDPGTPQPGLNQGNVEFIRATPDGRSAYFATASQLDPADQNTGADIYRWDEETGKSSCLTCVVPNANIASFGSAHLTQIMVSDDFSHVYFQSEEQLVPGHGEAGALNTYVLSGGTIRFVAGEGIEDLGISGNESRALLSADGNVLVFEGETGSGAPILTADAHSAQCINKDGELKPCRELYRYDDRDGSLECISCRHDAETTYSAFEEGKVRMSGDGRTIAFATPQPLVAHDVNQGPDIYEWRDGAVHLISDGVRSFPGGLTRPEVRGVDASGRDILFALVAPNLTGFEQDGQRNLYDARIGGGFLPPSPPAHCAEDSCQGPLQGAPALEGVASANESRGNLLGAGKPRHPCARKHGKAKRRCMRKQRRRAQPARANRNAGRAK